MDVDRVVELARKAIMSSQGFITAWEFDPYNHAVDGEVLHDELREALGISKEEHRNQPSPWASPQEVL